MRGLGRGLGLPYGGRYKVWLQKDSLILDSFPLFFGGEGVFMKISVLFVERKRFGMFFMLLTFETEENQ